MKLLYVIGPVNGPYKIGLAHSPSARLADLQVGIHGEWFRCTIRQIEAAIHAVAPDLEPHAEGQTATSRRLMQTIAMMGELRG